MTLLGYTSTLFSFPQKPTIICYFGQVNEKQMRKSCMMDMMVSLYYSRQQTETTLNWWIVKGVQL